MTFICIFCFWTAMWHIVLINKLLRSSWTLLHSHIKIVCIHLKKMYFYNSFIYEYMYLFYLFMFSFICSFIYYLVNIFQVMKQQKMTIGTVSLLPYLITLSVSMQHLLCQGTAVLNDSHISVWFDFIFLCR